MTNGLHQSTGEHRPNIVANGFPKVAELLAHWTPTWGALRRAVGAG